MLVLAKASVLLECWMRRCSRMPYAIGAIAESIAKFVEREWAEAEIRKHRNHVERLIKNSSRNITGKN